MDATANAINLIAGVEAHSFLGPCVSRAFFLCWAGVMLAPVILALLHGCVTSRRRGRHLAALSESLPPEAAELKRAFKEIASSVGLEVALAVSPGRQPRAVAHQVGLLRSRKFVEVSQRCLELGAIQSGKDRSRLIRVGRQSTLAA